VARPLNGIRAKLRRGSDHLDELQRQERAFLASGAYALVHEIDAESGLHYLRFRAYREPPVELGVIVGEVLYQFRSALDHLLTLAAQLRKPTVDHLQFPLCMSPEAFFDPPRTKRPSIESQLRTALRPEHLTLVKAYQPFRQEPEAPQQSPLAALAHLNNLDKHATLHVAYAAPRTSVLTEANDVVAARPVLLEDGAELYRYRPASPDVEVNYVIALGLSYGPMSAYRWITATSLQLMGDMVGWVVRDFTKATPEFGPLPPFKVPDVIPNGPTRPDVVAIARPTGTEVIG
jgi:hypothetical protein